MTEAAVLGNLGAVAVDQGDYGRAERLQNRALQLHRALGSAPNTCYALINLAEISRHLRDYTHANDLLAEAIAILREIGYTYAEDVALINLADVALAQAHLPRAASALLQSRQLFYDVGDQNRIVENADFLAPCAPLAVITEPQSSSWPPPAPSASTSAPRRNRSSGPSCSGGPRDVCWPRVTRSISRRQHRGQPDVARRDRRQWCGHQAAKLSLCQELC